MEYHQRLHGQIETILADLPGSAVKQLRRSDGALPVAVRRRLWRARAETGGWMYDDALEWIAHAWGRYRTEVPERHEGNSIVAIGAELGVSAPTLDSLCAAETTPRQCRTVIERILDVARAAQHPVCFARLSLETTQLHANRTRLPDGRTRAQHVKLRWRIDLDCAPTAPERNYL